MRKYNSETDYQILRDAILSVGVGGGMLTATKNALEASGIAWPGNFNQSSSEEAKAIDRDISRALQSAGNSAI